MNKQFVLLINKYIMFILKYILIPTNSHSNLFVNPKPFVNLSFLYPYP